MTTESKELALDDREFERFIRAAQGIDCDLRSQEAVFIGFVLGRLGLRPGELCHIHEDWINWRRRMIEISKHDDGSEGQGRWPLRVVQAGGEAKVEYAELSLDEARMDVLQEAIGDQLPRHVRSQIQAVHFASLEGDLNRDDVDRQLEMLLSPARTSGTTTLSSRHWTVLSESTLERPRSQPTRPLQSTPQELIPLS